MDAELSALRAKGPGSGDPVRNPVFQHEQRVGSARDAADATAVAARVTGEMAAEADQERLRIDGQVAAIEHATPGSDQARDAEAALARAERDGDEAVSVSLDSDAAEDDVRHREGKGLFHKDADAEGAAADEAEALHDEAVAGRDLADLDTLEQRVSAESASSASSASSTGSTGSAGSAG
jgi:hypothetical protein